MEYLIESIRKNLDYNIRIDESSKFMCLTDLQEAYNKLRFKNNWKQKRIDSILSSTDNATRIYYILKKRGYIKEDTLDDFIDFVNKFSLVKAMKKYNAYISKGARESRIVMCDPCIWFMIAYELNESMYADIATSVDLNGLIDVIETNNIYNKTLKLCESISCEDAKEIINKINWIISRSNNIDIKNTKKHATDDINKIQSFIEISIKIGDIKNKEDLLLYLKRIYECGVVKPSNTQRFKTYIIKDIVSGLYKIGRSSNIEKRFKQISSVAINSILYATLDFDIEEKLHKELKSYSRSNEWFDIPESEIVKIVNKYKFKLTQIV